MFADFLGSFWGELSGRVSSEVVLMCAWVRAHRFFFCGLAPEFVKEC